MTEFLNYENLTWPEVEALPRDLPLILPFGNAYPIDQIAHLLGNPTRIGLLPSIPFGWYGSGLQVTDPILGSIVNNLISSLQEDGFTRVFLLTPPDIQFDPSTHQIQLPDSESRFQARDLPPDDQKEKVIIFPIGHTEQHGCHLPLSTDTLIIEAIGRKTAQATGSSAFCMPAMPYGVSTHRSSFAGTLNSGGRAFEDFWLNIIDALVKRGFARFYLISGHGGNCSFLVNVIKYAGERYPDIFCATASLYLTGSEGIASVQKYRQSAIGGMGHACELETSLILFLRPELVHMERVVDEINFIATPSYYMDWVDGGPLVANPPWDDDTLTGAYGAGSLATSQKGAIWLQAAINEKSGHIAEIHEQFNRRRAARLNKPSTRFVRRLASN